MATKHVYRVHRHVHWMVAHAGSTFGSLETRLHRMQLTGEVWEALRDLHAAIDDLAAHTAVSRAKPRKRRPAKGKHR